MKSEATETNKEGYTPAQAYFKAWLEANYEPDGFPAQMVGRTSREMAYSVREMMNVDLNDIVRVLRKEGYSMSSGSTPAWILYEKVPQDKIM